MKLSICIATLKNREQSFVSWLQNNAPEWCEVLVDFGDDCLGDKRQRILEFAVGEYVVVVDDDDILSEDYFDEVLKGIESDCDVICIGLKRYEDGVLKHEYRSGFDNPYDGEASGLNHFCPVKRELALKSGYRSIGRGEDLDFASGLEYLVKTRYYTPGFVYYQMYVTREKEYDRFPNFIDYIKSNPRIFLKEKNNMYTIGRLINYRTGLMQILSENASEKISISATWSIKRNLDAIEPIAKLFFEERDNLIRKYAGEDAEIIKPDNENFKEFKEALDELAKQEEDVPLKKISVATLDGVKVSPEVVGLLDGLLED
jgi:glycosyltransferase involved in cell wall biosynthesis